MLPGAQPVAFSPVGGAGILPTGLAGPAPVGFSDRGWTGEPSDTIWPNRHFSPRVEQPLSLSRSIPISPLDQQRVVPTSATQSFLNGDGGLDDMISVMAIDGRDVEVKIGAPLYDGSQFQTLFKGTAGGWRCADKGRIELTLRDLVWPLDKPIQKNRYGGTGGLDGTPDLAGVPKPLAFGRPLNIELKLIDPVNLIYQFHDGSAGGVLNCYVNAAPLTQAGDVADILLAAPAAGFYSTQLSGGYVRLGASPDGIVTADVIGDNKWGVTPLNTADVVYRILRDRLDLSDGLMDGPSFTALALAWPGVIGLYIPAENAGAVQTLNRLLGPVLGFMVHGRTGTLRVGSLALSMLSGINATTPKATLDDKDSIEVTLMDVPDTLNPPFWRVQVGWGLNWTPMSAQDIAGVIIDTQPERYQFLTSPARYVKSEDAAIQIRHPQAQDIYVDSLFVEQAEALRLAEIIIANHGRMPMLARVACQSQGYLLENNDVIRVDNPRYGLSGGRPVVVITVELDVQMRASSLVVMW
ncbi:MAG: hypothetical protein IPK59_04110 [Rhodospirillaceae bacterium]|nr:hypothetical protein [Rhodospirillaceae bacterium]